MMNCSAGPQRYANSHLPKQVTILAKLLQVACPAQGGYWSPLSLSLLYGGKPLPDQKVVGKPQHCRTSNACLVT